MSTVSREGVALRLKLEQALYGYVVKKDQLPTSTTLMQIAGCQYIEAREFISAKVKHGTYTIDQIKKDGGMPVKHGAASDDEKQPHVHKKRESTGNLLHDAVIAATQQAMDEAKPAPLIAKDQAFNNIEFTKKMISNAASTEEESKGYGADIVTRKSIWAMTEDEHNRFFDAVDTMLKTLNKSSGHPIGAGMDGPGSSRYFRIATIHGYPGPIYCTHGIESFPCWHRIYLHKFELELQAADRENGNDGKIGLPYWDWTETPSKGLPPIVRERFNKWPTDLFPKDVPVRGKSKDPYARPEALKYSDNKGIIEMITSWLVNQNGRQCLLNTIFAEFATVGFQAPPYNSVENAHNMIHVLVGNWTGAMALIPWSAFDLVFFMHHCCVDRIFQSYLALEPDSAEEFANQNPELYKTALTPFMKPNDDWYYPRDAFGTTSLGYNYDSLIPAPTKIILADSHVVFPQIKVSDFGKAGFPTYGIHIYIVQKGKAFTGPKNIAELNVNSPNYAGGTVLFAQGKKCSNCQTRPPFDLFVDITRTLKKLGISRYDAVIKVYIDSVWDDNNTLYDNEQLRSEQKPPIHPLPEPYITGPMFENMKQALGPNKQNNQNEVRALQQYLQRFGYYDDDKKIDGDYGPVTTQAVKDFQKAAGLHVDGKAGRKVKEKMVNSKRCSNKDPFAKNTAQDTDIGEPFKKTDITYSIGVQPGYLNRLRVEEVIAAAFKIWSDVISLEFTLVDDVLEDADIALNWTKGNPEDKRMGFNPAGGVLGHGGKGFVNFDINERWVYGDAADLNDDKTPPLSVISDPKTWYRGKPTVSLFYVAIQGIGHALGLDHSMDPKDLMGPYYTPKITKLTKNDIARIQDAYVFCSTL